VATDDGEEASAGVGAGFAAVTDLVVVEVVEDLAGQGDRGRWGYRDLDPGSGGPTETVADQVVERRKIEKLGVRATRFKFTLTPVIKLLPQLLVKTINVSLCLLYDKF